MVVPCGLNSRLLCLLYRNAQVVQDTVQQSLSAPARTAGRASFIQHAGIYLGVSIPAWRTKKMRMYTTPLSRWTALQSSKKVGVLPYRPA